MATNGNRAIASWLLDYISLPKRSKMVSLLIRSRTILAFPGNCIMVLAFFSLIIILKPSLSYKLLFGQLKTCPGGLLNLLMSLTPFPLKFHLIRFRPLFKPLFILFEPYHPVKLLSSVSCHSQMEYLLVTPSSLP